MEAVNRGLAWLDRGQQRMERCIIDHGKATQVGQVHC